jgi:F0F1-type ATP synthase delta subunit
MEKIYAQALWRMIENGMEPTKAVHALYEKLKMLGREALMPRIAVAFRNLAERSRAHDALTITVADQENEASALREARAAFGDAKLADVNVRVDKDLIGGWRLEGREKLIDASYKNQLLKMYEKLTK